MRYFLYDENGKLIVISGERQCYCSEGAALTARDYLINEYPGCYILDKSSGKVVYD